MPHHRELNSKRSVDWCKRLLAQPPGPWPAHWAGMANIEQAFREMFDQFVAAAPAPPRNWSRAPRPGNVPELAADQSRGIVICGGGWRFFPSLYVTVRMIRRTGCALPIQIWYLGDRGEFDERFAAAIEPFDVGFVDACAVAKDHPRRVLGGWEIKPFAVAYAPWREVFYFDADSYPVADPETAIMEHPRARQAGAVFWPDQHPLKAGQYARFGVEAADRVAFESGQFYVDKAKNWKALAAAVFLNDFSDYVYSHIYGDKDTFNLAWHKTDSPFVLAAQRPGWNTVAFLHADLDGRPFVVHRTRDKFRFGAGFVDDQPVANFENYMTPQWGFSKLVNVPAGKLAKSPHAGVENLYVESLPGEAAAHAYRAELDAMFRPDGKGEQTASTPAIRKSMAAIIGRRRRRRTAAALLTHHRSASQFARAIASRLMREAGRSVRGLSYGGGPRPGDQLGDCSTSQAIAALDFADLVANANACPAFVDLFDLYGDWRAVHVWRDPRDVVVSTYWSTKTFHLANLPGIAEQREALAGLSIEGGLCATIDWLTWLWDQLRAWPPAENRMLSLSFSELTQNTPAALFAIARHLGVAEGLGLRAVRQIAADFTFARFADGRAVGDEKRDHHFRKGIAGDWRGTFTPTVQEYFTAAAGDLLDRWGE